MRILFAFLLCSSAVFAQKSEASEAEERELTLAVSEAGNSPQEFIRALEKHLKKYPNSPRKPDLERAMVKGAIDAKDQARIVEYGERVLARESDDVQILDAVTRALLTTEARDTSERALKYARRYVELVTAMRSQKPSGHGAPGQWQQELDRGLARALALQARATGNLGQHEEAVKIAEKSYESAPNAESAREIGRWLARSGKEEEAVQHIADAFTIPDARNTDTERAKDRARMGELYRKVKGSEKGLGDVILEAYDRTTALVAARRLRMRESDPNASATSLMEFTLSTPDGQKLQLAALKGKTVVFDFWATWCGPCRVQHPLYEEVKQRFKDSPDVVFLSVNTDEDRESVAGFLKENKWDNKVYFEDGLARILQISSIPTTIIVNKNGEIFTRMNGFVPERFVDMLTERIRDAMKG